MTDLHETEQALTSSLTTIRAYWSALLNPATSGGRNGGSATNYITLDDHDERDHDIDRATRIVSLRREVLDVLNAISRWVMEERPVTKALPDGLSALSMSLFLERHASWIAAEDDGYEVDRIAGLANRVQNLAVPRKREWVALGSCPLVPDGEDPTVCGGQVRAWPRADDRDGEVMARCQTCGTEAVATWWESRMFDDAELKVWLTDADLVTFVHRTFGRVVVEATIRQWVKRGVLEASGRDEKGRRLFHREAVVYALDRHEKRERAGMA